MITNIKDLSSPLTKNFLKGITSNNSVLGWKIGIVSILRTGEIINIWKINKITFPDQLSSKQISIQGQEISDLLSNFVNFESSTLTSIQNSLNDYSKCPIQTSEYSENEFGVVVFGNF